MDDPSPTARDVIAAYRRGRVLSDDARERVESRLAVSIDAGAHARARVETRRRLAIAAVAALAVAACIVLLARGLQSTPHRSVEPDDRGQSPYERDDEAREPVDAPPPAPTTSELREPEPAPVEVRAARTPSPSRAPDREVVPPADTSLAEELAIVRRIRAAIDRDDPEAALVAVAEHERRFAAGQLVEERKSLRIEALCRAGKLPQARAESQAFVRDHPGSPHVDRVRSACASP